MRLKIALLVVMAFPVSAQTTQTPQVPHKMQFAGMTLTIRDDARREIQNDVNNLRQSPRHFAIKVERARTYFPIIEKIFKEENLPEDFKYLVLQESALIPDAVSTSNAVGFWQFKDFTAVEMGLRVDKEIDERMNIVSSTRAAARYLKKNNYFFNNWLYALQAYQMGAGGVMQAVKDTQGGARHMEVTSNTYWYVKKYLAHKVAFEDAVSGPGQLELLTYENNGRKSLKELAAQVIVNEDELRALNKWTSSGNIPGDRMYAVVIPAKGNLQAINTLPSAVAVKAPEVKGVSLVREENVRINGVAVIRARPGETAATLSKRAGIDLSYFLRCNDLSISEPLVAGAYYFTSKKRARAREAYHKAAAGERLWEISQRYGVKLKKLKRYNRLASGSEIQTGTTIWLSAVKPRDEKKSTFTETVIEVDMQEAFGWSSSSIRAQPEERTVLPRDTTNQQAQSGIVKVQRDTTTITSAPEATADSQSPAIQTVAPPPAGEEPAQSNPGSHVVQAGETLYAIGKKYGVSVTDIVAWNDLKLQEGIKPGQILKLQGEEQTGDGEVEAAAKAPEIIHEVQPTDTLYSIARRYGVTIKALMDWNNKSDFNLSVGEKLRIIQQ